MCPKNTFLDQAVYQLWWLSLTKDMQTEQLLCWSGMTNTEHSTTSSSNEKEHILVLFLDQMNNLKPKKNLKDVLTPNFRPFRFVLKKIYIDLCMFQSSATSEAEGI